MKNTKKPRFTSRKIARSMAKTRMRRNGEKRIFHKMPETKKSPFSLCWKNYVYRRSVMG